MTTCRNAARIIAESHDRTLSLGERLALRFHLLICSACRRAARQLHMLRALVRDAADVSDQEAVPMSTEARERVAGAIAQDATRGA